MSYYLPAYIRYRITPGGPESRLPVNIHYATDPSGALTTRLEHVIAMRRGNVLSATIELCDAAYDLVDIRDSGGFDYYALLLDSYLPRAEAALAEGGILSWVPPLWPLEVTLVLEHENS
jgi:hypothetical protein